MGNFKVRLSNRFGFIESKINIVYNAAKALQHKQEIDDAVAAYKAKIQNNIKSHVIIGICLVSLWVIFLIATRGADSVIAVGFASCFPIGIYIGVRSWLTDINKPSEKYTPDIEYYLATEGKRVLCITVYPTFECLPPVQIITENADHTTTKTEIAFKVLERTDLQEIVLDVNEGVVYVPYERENGKRC